MDEDIIMKFALEKPAFRILVNTPASLGAVGYTNELQPSMTLGPGTFGGSIVSDNVSARHMINIKRLAFETRPLNAPDEATVRVSVLNAQPEPQKMPAMKTAQPKPDIAPKTHEPLAHKPPISHNPVTPVPQPTVSKSWLDEIDERIRLKAGNVPTHKREHEKPATEKPTAPSAQHSGSGMLGTGISEEEVERIIKDFSRR